MISIIKIYKNNIQLKNSIYFYNLVVNILFIFLNFKKIYILFLMCN